ncbi:MAG: SAM hydroxide adenosyltransferase, partial [Pseudonocardiaceae bacterium]
QPVPAQGLVQLHLPVAAVTGGMIEAEILLADRFGNLQLAATVADLDTAGLVLGSRLRVHARPAVCCATFAEIPEGGLGLLPDAFGRLQIAVNQGSAARLLGLRPGQTVTVTARPSPG